MDDSGESSAEAMITTENRFTSMIEIFLKCIRNNREEYSDPALAWEM